MSIISEAIDLVSRAKKLADEMSNLDLREVISELRAKILDVKEENLQLREENTNLKAEARKLSMPAETTIKRGLRFKLDGEGPFCNGCFSKGQLVPLSKLPDEGMVMTGDWKCPVCKEKYWDRWDEH